MRVILILMVLMAWGAFAFGAIGLAAFLVHRRATRSKRRLGDVGDVGGPPGPELGRAPRMLLASFGAFGLAYGLYVWTSVAQSARNTMIVAGPPVAFGILAGITLAITRPERS